MFAMLLALMHGVAARERSPAPTEPPEWTMTCPDGVEHVGSLQDGSLAEVRQDCPRGPMHRGIMPKIDQICC